jgi:hypothetical protein
MLLAPLHLSQPCGRAVSHCREPRRRVEPFLFGEAHLDNELLERLVIAGTAREISTDRVFLGAQTESRTRDLRIYESESELSSSPVVAIYQVLCGS